MAFAILVIGLLHGLLGVMGLAVGIEILALRESDRISAGRIRYIGIKNLLAALMLLLCGLFAWYRPGVAWVFAVLALAAYLPLRPDSAKTRWEPRENEPSLAIYDRFKPIVLAVRAAGAALLALLASGLPG
jgi:hypothetical protein